MARDPEPPEGETPLPDTETPQPVEVSADAPPIPGTAPAADPAAVEPADTAEPAVPEPTIDELRAEADKRGLQVQGSGKDGRVLKADLQKALADTPPPPAGRPPLILVAQAAAANLTPTED